MNFDEPWKPEETKDEKAKKPKQGLPKKQYTINEYMDSSKLNVFTYFMILFFVVLYFATAKIDFMRRTEEKEHNFDINSNGKYDFNATCRNLTEKNVFVLFEYDLMPNQDSASTPAEVNLKVISEHFYKNGSFFSTRVNRVWHTFGTAEAFLPLHYMPTKEISTVNVNIMANPYRDNWIGKIKMRCAYGVNAPFDLAPQLHTLFFIIYIVCMINFYKNNIGKHHFLRSTIVSILLPIASFSQFPYEYIGVDMHYADALRDLISAIAFMICYILWFLKVHGFNTECFSETKNVKAIAIGIFGCGYGIYHVFEKHLHVFSLPSAPDGSDHDGGDFFMKYIYEFATCFALYKLITAFMDKNEKKDLIDMNRFSADFYPLLCASLISAVLYAPIIKDKACIENPLMKCIRYVMWDFAIWYESCVSIQISGTPLTNDNENENNQVGADVDEASLNPLNYVPDENEEEEENKEAKEEAPVENNEQKEDKKKKKKKKVIIVKKKKRSKKQKEEVKEDAKKNEEEEEESENEKEDETKNKDENENENGEVPQTA